MLTILTSSFEYRQDLSNGLPELKWLKDVKYEKAILLSFNCKKNCKDKLVCDELPMDSLGKFSITSESPINLNHSEANKILELIASSQFYKNSGLSETLGCFKPTISLALLDSLGLPLVLVNISNECQQLEVISFSGKKHHHLSYFDFGCKQIEKLCFKYKLNCCISKKG